MGNTTSGPTAAGNNSQKKSGIFTSGNSATGASIKPPVNPTVNTQPSNAMGNNAAAAAASAATTGEAQQGGRRRRRRIGGSKNSRKNY